MGRESSEAASSWAKSRTALGANRNQSAALFAHDNSQTPDGDGGCTTGVCEDNQSASRPGSVTVACFFFSFLSFFGGKRPFCFSTLACPGVTLMTYGLLLDMIPSVCATPHPKTWGIRGLVPSRRKVQPGGKIRSSPSWGKKKANKARRRRGKCQHARKHPIHILMPLSSPPPCQKIRRDSAPALAPLAS